VGWWYIPFVIRLVFIPVFSFSHFAAFGVRVLWNCCSEASYAPTPLRRDKEVIMMKHRLTEHPFLTPVQLHQSTGLVCATPIYPSPYIKQANP
jgi:hypothetical protein